MRLENKVALISGGARGMGAAEAKLFAREGARVVIGDLLAEDGRRTEAEINETGGECLFVRLDVTDESSWREAVAATVARFGKLDILVNNAGIYRTERVEETSGELWDQVYGDQLQGGVPWDEARYPGDAEVRRRLHNQHLFRGGPCGQYHVCRLHRFQGCGKALHQVHRHPTRHGRHPGEFRPSGHY